MGNRNGLNAFKAHMLRAGVESTYTRELIESYTFMTYGKVTKYASGRVDVMCGSLKFTNVEVLVLGVNGWGIKPVPAVGDRVLLIGSQSPIVDIKTFSASGSMPPYDESGLKAIPVCDETTATQLITVDMQKIEITGATKLTVNAQGVQFQDANGNKVTTSSSGVAFEDANKNKVTTSSSGIVIEDKGGCKIESNGSKTTINGALEISK